MTSKTRPDSSNVGFLSLLLGGDIVLVWLFFFFNNFPSHPLTFGLFMHHREFIFFFLPSFVFVFVSRRLGQGDQMDVPGILAP